MEKEDIEFMSELKAAGSLKPSKASQIFLWTVVAFFAWLIIWASFSKIDERVRGVGQVMPSSAVQVVQSLEGGILSEILVNEGDIVKKNQVLIRIDDVQFAAQGRGIESQIVSLKAKKARLIAESSGEKFVVDTKIANKYSDIIANEEKLYNSRQKELGTALSIVEDEVKQAESNLIELKNRIESLTKSKSLLAKELKIAAKMVEQKAMPEIEKLKAERSYNDTEGALESARQSLHSFQAKLRVVKNKKEEKLGAFKSHALGELNEVETKIAAIKESLTSVRDKVDRAELRSPVEGIVQKVYLRTIGGVVKPAQKLMEIVPLADDLMIKAKIAPADVAFLKPGQHVKVKITAYDPQLYGSINGTLERIGANTVEDAQGNVFFEIDVRTDKNYLGTKEAPLRIFSGMISQVEVITGKRTVMTYLLKPVLRMKDRAFSEK